MSRNPYDSLSKKSSRPIGLGLLPPSNQPLGVSILSMFHIIGGIVIFGAQFMLFSEVPERDEAIQSIGISPAMLLVGVNSLAILIFASGVGMSLGARWGWWLSTFYYLYSVLRNVAALISVVVLAGKFEGGSHGPEYYIFKHGSRIIVHSVLFLYFFKGNVLEYFGLREINKRSAIGALAGTGFGMIVISSAVSSCGFCLDDMSKADSKNELTTLFKPSVPYLIYYRLISERLIIR